MGIKQFLTFSFFFFFSTIFSSLLRCFLDRIFVTTSVFLIFVALFFDGSTKSSSSAVVLYSSSFLDSKSSWIFFKLVKKLKFIIFCLINVFSYLFHFRIVDNRLDFPSAFDIESFLTHFMR